MPRVNPVCLVGCVGLALLAGCGDKRPPPLELDAPAASAAASGAAPASAASAAASTASLLAPAGSADRLPPPEVPPVERDGVRFAQAADGHAVGADQVGGVLVASSAATGQRLWTLVVYANRVEPGHEADSQWVFFKSMAFDPDGRLRIVNEAGQAFRVDVRQRTVEPAR
ncbi:hypothetical protein [Aquabacterium sp.]|uniref:hypothetical protein n=1 Tax=Aquabacterium sp. TaxID=1872578 RepID=UPI0035B10989